MPTCLVKALLHCVLYCTVLVCAEHADCVPGGAAPPPHLPHAEPGLGADRHGRGRGQDRGHRRGGVSGRDIQGGH